MSINKLKFEAQQYLIRQAEIDLVNKTQILLTDIVRRLSEEQKEIVKNRLDYVFSISESGVCIVIWDNFIDATINRDIDELEQREIKLLIDDIIEVI